MEPVYGHFIIIIIINVWRILKLEMIVIIILFTIYQP